MGRKDSKYLIFFALILPMLFWGVNEAFSAEPNEKISFKGRLVWATGGSITSKFGYRTHPVTGEKDSFHSGIDIGAPKGTPIVAAADGTVTVAAYGGDAGLMIKINHGGGLETIYMHCSVLQVKVGQNVTQGQQIALVGNTGRGTGYHLHFGVKVNGIAKDPQQLLTGSPGAPGQPGNVDIDLSSEIRQEPILEQILREFMDKRDAWLKDLPSKIQWTFFMLLLISFIWESAKIGLTDKLSFGEILRLIVSYSVYGGLFRWVFANPSVLNGVASSFLKLAEKTTGYNVDIFGMLLWAEDITETLWMAGSAAISNSSLWEIVFETVTGLLSSLLAVNIIVISVVFFLIVGQMIVALIETIMITLCGFVLVVFDGLKGMFDYWKVYLRALIGCGLKLFMLGIICGMMQAFLEPVILEVSADSVNGFLISLSIVSGILSVLWTIASNVTNIANTIIYSIPQAAYSAAGK